MNFKTVKQALYEKIKLMSEEDFYNFLTDLERVYYKTHNRKIKKVGTENLDYNINLLKEKMHETLQNLY